MHNEENANTLSASKTNDLLYAAYYSYNYESREEGVRKLTNILEMSDSLNEEELAFVNRSRDVWIKSIDAEYVPAGSFSINSDVDVLFLKGEYALQQGKYQDYLRYSWMALQYCASGTLRFLRILSNLIDAFTAIDDVNMARHAANMFLSHYDLMVGASKYAFIPIGDSSPSDTRAWLKKADKINMTLPWEAALKYIEEDASPCWVRILRMNSETAADEFKQTSSYQESYKALQKYYRRTGDVSNLEFLKVYE